MSEPVKTGRPSTYKSMYGNLCIEHMATGASLTAFAAEIGVARSTINVWMNEHPEFSEAVEVGKAKCAAWWENLARKIAENGGGNGPLISFALKNMAIHDWRDRQEIEHSGPQEVKFTTIYQSKDGSDR